MLRRFSVAALLILTLIGSGKLFAQDPSFSQFYANPLYLNPALTGGTECGRFNLNYRNQWPSLNTAFVTYNASFDMLLPSIASGVGVSFIGDRQGDGAISSNYISGFYSFKFNINQNLYASAGFQGTYIQQKLDWNKLVFADQIDPNTGNIMGSTAETPPDNPNKNLIDFSAGFTLGYLDKAFGGISVHHLTQPDRSFYSSGEDKLNMKVTVHGGMLMNMTEGSLGNDDPDDLMLSPNLLYQQQGKFHQLNVGTYVMKYPFVAGVWFRHNFENVDAAIVLVGLHYNNMRFGYSYDFTLSKLTNSTGGTHEISFSYEFCIYYSKEKRRVIKAIKAPSF